MCSGSTELLAAVGSCVCCAGLTVLTTHKVQHFEPGLSPLNLLFDVGMSQMICCAAAIHVLQRLLGSEGVKLEFTPKAIKEVAAMAEQLNKEVSNGRTVSSVLQQATAVGDPHMQGICVKRAPAVLVAKLVQIGPHRGMPVCLGIQRVSQFVTACT